MTVNPTILSQQVDDDYEEFAEEVENEHIDSSKSHLAQPQVDQDLVNPARVLDDDNEVIIGAARVMVNPTIQFVDVQFNEDQLANDEWLQMMQQKHLIDMMLFSERSPLSSENQVEDNLFGETCLSKELEAIEEKKEMKEEKSLIRE